MSDDQRPVAAVESRFTSTIVVVHSATEWENLAWDFEQRMASRSRASVTEEWVPTRLEFREDEDGPCSACTQEQAPTYRRVDFSGELGLETWYCPSCAVHLHDNYVKGVNREYLRWFVDEECYFE